MLITASSPDYTVPYSHPIGVTALEFSRGLRHQKTRVPGAIAQRCLYDPHDDNVIRPR